MKSVLVTVGMIAGTVLLIWGAMHVVIRPVNPAQPTPEGHFASACWACHFVAESAEIVEP